MNILGVIGIILGLVTIMTLISKGFNGVIAAIIASAIVILTNEMPFMTSLLGPKDSYVASLGNFVVQNFIIFLLGSILAKYMEKSGAIISIADKILDIFGTEKPYPVMVAIFVISALLTYGGISMFVVVFAIIPLAKPLFKRLNIAWNLVAIPVMGGMATFTNTMMPGTPSATNFIPSSTLGTPLTASPIIGIVTSGVAILFILFYMKFALKKSLAKGEQYADFAKETAIDKGVVRDNLPPFFLSLVPIIALIAIIIAFAKVPYIIVVALTVSIILSALLMRKYIPSQKAALNEATLGSFGTTMVTGNTIAFGGILTAAPAFKIISDFITSIAISPLLSLSISAVVVSFVTGSSVGTVGIVAQNFAPQYIEMGLNPALVHRIIAISAGFFGIMPHTGLGITFNEVSDLNLKNNFKYQFTTVTGSTAIALAVALLMASFM